MDDYTKCMILISTLDRKDMTEEEIYNSYREFKG
jgi:hypothetical protein